MKKERKQKRIYIKVARLESTINIEKSTSGGIFGELARKVLSEEGIVYGAAFEKDYKSVHHVRCDNLEKLQPILKSKYVKSNLENTFKEAKNDLDNNKTVLYSGTPCQIAALKQFLKKEYDNLLTVDIVCHGTPIPKIWKNYANYLEKEEGSRIKYVDFRYFNPEDPSKNLYIEFENGTVMNEALYDNSDGRAFSIGLINLEACGHCQFKDFANKSDITLGDAWGYNNKMYPYKNSLIFINNEKGKKYYDSIKKKLIEFHDFDFKEMLPSCYPILHPTLNHYNQGKVNANARNMDKELWYWLDEMNGLYKDKKAVGILNFSYENINFGANLVPYSLSEALKKLGYHPWNIDFDVFKDLDTIKKYQSLLF